MQRRRLSRFFLATGVLGTGMIFPFSISKAATDKVSAYAYEDTRRLVALVEQAATLMEQKGEDALREFGQKGSRWFTDPYYLFIYQLDGTCVFHPVQAEWIGKNMSELRDMNSAQTSVRGSFSDATTGFIISFLPFAG